MNEKGKKKEELHFAILNYLLGYPLPPKISYHTLQLGVTFAVMFNRMLPHMTSTCILLGWNKLKRLRGCLDLVFPSLNSLIFA